ncbi:MAG TPA: hypothetical protein V6D20_09840 [Candidatus Obscuribacterales bacterium]
MLGLFLGAILNRIDLYYRSYVEVIEAIAGESTVDILDKQGIVTLMVRAVQNIEQDIQRLDAALEAIAQELHGAYQTYMETLGEALRKQLVLASYHLCTQGYPDRFLALSLSQRQALQQELRQLGLRSQQQLLQFLTPPHSMPKAVSKPPSLLEALVSGVSPEDLQDDLSLEQDAGSHDVPLGDGATMEGLAIADLADPTAEPARLTPYDVVQWRDALEDAIAELLQGASHEANRLLQRMNMLSSALPEPVLEVASKAEMLSESASGPPNLLKLRIEAEVDNKDEAETAQLMVIHLRLSEIEFSDPNFSLKRAKIRELFAQVSQIGHDYRRVHREKAIAEAEAAWRSSWYEG